MIINQGDSTSQIIPVGQIMTVVTGANSTGSITRLGDQPGQASQSQSSIAQNTTQTYGPYPVVARMQIECLTGSLTATLAPCDIDSFVTDEIDDAVLSADPLILTLPTSDPEVAGAIWNDAGTVKVSAGPA